jgi:hypothetical protein
MVEIDARALVLFLLLPFVLLLAAAGAFALILRSMGFRPVPAEPWDGEADGGRWERLERPWWGNPLLWLGVSAVFLLLGLFVLPHLLGGVFLFFPFLWVGGWRRRPRREPPPRREEEAERARGPWG